MAFRTSSLFMACLLVLAACAQNGAVQNDENTVAGDAAKMDAVVQNSVGNVVDSARSAVHAVTGAQRAIEAALNSGQKEGWGHNADAFTGKGIALERLTSVRQIYAVGDMGCGFVPEGSSAATLAAKADVDPGARAIAVVSNDGARQRLAGMTAGGFGALAQGTRLIGQGVAIDITLTSRQSLTPVGQQSSYPASMAVTASGQQKHVYAGRWICGLQD